jgi:hypothetical protein
MRLLVTGGAGYTGRPIQAVAAPPRRPGDPAVLLVASADPVTSPAAPAR